MVAPAFDLQPMSIGDILDRTIRFYRRFPAHTLCLAAVPHVTLTLLLFGLQAAVLFFPSPTRSPAPPWMIAAFPLVTVVFVWAVS